MAGKDDKFDPDEFQALLDRSDKGEPAPQDREKVRGQQGERDIEVVEARDPGATVQIDISERKEAKRSPLKVDDDAGDEVEGVSTLREQLARETAARKAAEDRAALREKDLAAQRAEAGRWRNEAEGAKYNEITNAIASVGRQQTQLKTEWSAAMADGDFSKGADLQDQMAQLHATNIRLQEGKVAMEYETQQRAKAPDPAADPVEAYLKKNQINSPQSQAWVRAHPDVATDPAKAEMVRKAHNGFLAEYDESDVGSPAYYAFIEQRYAGKKADEVTDVDAGDDPVSSAARVERRTAPAAPVSRGTSAEIASRNTRLSNRVELSALEMDFAKQNGQTPLEYAREKQKLQREGRLGTGT